MTNTLEKQGYLILQQTVSPEVCALLSDYARLKARIRPHIRKRGDPLAFIHREYADPMMEVMLEKLTPHVEKATGLSLWPTLSFYYAYRQGNQLKPHKDRSSCEYVAGLCIGVDEAYQKKEGSWPLVIEVGGEPIVLKLQAGDLVIFKGNEIKHWREPFTGQWFISAIFGYVNKIGPYAFQKYDQRKSLGKQHVGMLRWSLSCLLHRFM